MRWKRLYFLTGATLCFYILEILQILLLQRSENHCSNYYAVFNLLSRGSHRCKNCTEHRPFTSDLFWSARQRWYQMPPNRNVIPINYHYITTVALQITFGDFVLATWKFFVFFFKRVLHRGAPSNNNCGPFYGYMKREWHYRPMLSCRSKHTWMQTNCAGWTLRDQIEASLEKYLQLSSSSSWAFLFYLPCFQKIYFQNTSLLMTWLPFFKINLVYPPVRGFTWIFTLLTSWPALRKKKPSPYTNGHVIAVVVVVVFGVLLR